MKTLCLRKILVISIFQTLLVFCLNMTKAEVPVDDVRFVGSQGQDIRQMWDAGQRRQAMKHLSAWTKSDKKSGDPLAMAAILEFEKKEFKKCVKLCKKALARSPQLAEAYYWRGRAFEELNKPIEAINEYRAAILAKGSFPIAEDRISKVNALVQALGGPGQK